MKPNKQSGFTLVEMLIALSIGCLALGAVAMMLVNTVLIWRDSTALWHQTILNRQIREQILRGADRQHGLREVCLSGLVTNGSSDLLTFNAMGESNTVPCEIGISGGYLSYKVDDGTSKRLNRIELPMGSQGFYYDAATKTLTCVISNTIQSGNRTFGYRQEIKTRVIND